MSNKIYVVKGCLSKGIRVFENPKFYQSPTGMVRVEDENDLYEYFYNGEWFTDEQQAIVQAEAMRKEAIEMAELKIEKLRALSFNLKQNIVRS